MKIDKDVLNILNESSAPLFTFDDLPKELEEFLYDDKNYSIAPEIQEFVENNADQQFEAWEVPDLLEQIRDFALSLAEKDLIDSDLYDEIDKAIDAFLEENADYFNESRKSEDKYNGDVLLSIALPIKLYDQIPFNKELLIKHDENGFSTLVNNPRVLGKDTELRAESLEFLKARILGYYKSINYNVQFEQATANYHSDAKGLYHEPITESRPGWMEPFDAKESRDLIVQQIQELAEILPDIPEVPESSDARVFERIEHQADLISRNAEVMQVELEDMNESKNEATLADVKFEGLDNGQILLQDLIELAKSNNLPLDSAILIPSKSGGRTLAGKAKMVHFTGNNYGIELQE